MNRCRKMPLQWNVCRSWYYRWHGFFCPECRQWRRADRKVARGFRAIRRAPPPVGLEAQIMAGLGLEEPVPETTAPSSRPGPGPATWLACPTVARSARVGIAILALVLTVVGLEWAERIKDARVTAVIEGLQAREQRLREISITYDFRLVHRLPLEGNRATGASTTALQPPGKMQELEIYRTRYTWACKGRKMLLDQAGEWVRGKPHPRVQYLYDGEKILTRYYREPSDKRQPKEDVSDSNSLVVNIRHGAANVGLLYFNQPVSEMLKMRAHVRRVGYERVGEDRCLMLDIDDPVQDTERTYGRARLWIDLQHGFLLRRVQQYDMNDRRTLEAEMLATEPREYAPGLFLATRVVYWDLNVIEEGDRVRDHKYGTVPTIVSTAAIRRVVVGGLPDRLFRSTPSARTAAFDTRTGARYGSLPRRASDREVAAAADRARALVSAKALPGQLHVGPDPQSMPARDQDCGAQCLYVICQTLGVGTTIEELSRLAHTNDTGTSLEGLAEAARAKGLRAEGIRVPLDALRRVRKPVIAVSANHFYLLMGFNGPAAVLLSPPNQIFVMPENKLREAWDGRVLLVRR